MKTPTEYLAEIGRKGGKATGPRKARSAEFYKELSRKGVEARKRKALTVSVGDKHE